ncbi:MAG: rRNA adenine N-6-methyltransferase family protein, partial [Chloroflexota bacterium]
MELPPIRVPDLLRRYGLRPDKSLGQNFLIDESALAQVAAAAGLLPGETALEIGPGLGSLTRHLAAAAQRVIAVELDAGLLPALNETLAPFNNVTVVQGDILELDLQRLLQG